MGSPCSDPRDAVRRMAWSNLMQFALPDSRFSYDMSAFIPDFRGSASAIRRLIELPCYKHASALLIEPHNCLQELRYQALKDGKKVLVSTYGLRRGFMLLDPRKMSEDRFELASLLDGMERPGVGRSVSWTQMQEEGLRLDMCVAGAVAVTLEGLRIGRGHGWFDLQWGMFMDRGMIVAATPVAVVVHTCQIVRGEPYRSELQAKPWDANCSFIISQDEIIETGSQTMPKDGVMWHNLAPDLLAELPPLQELKGIQMMENIMNGAEILPQPEIRQQKQSENLHDADELMGIQMVERIMKGYRP